MLTLENGAFVVIEEEPEIGKQHHGVSIRKPMGNGTPDPYHAVEATQASSQREPAVVSQLL